MSPLISLTQPRKLDMADVAGEVVLRVLLQQVTRGPEAEQEQEQEVTEQRRQREEVAQARVQRAEEGLERELAVPVQQQQQRQQPIWQAWISCGATLNSSNYGNWSNSSRRC